MMKRMTSTIICLLMTILLTFTITGCSETLGDAPQSQNSTILATTFTHETSATFPMLYEKDETINAFLNHYNTVNPTAPINMNDFSPYYHHGREHEDQLRGWIGNIEIVISHGYTGKDMDIEVDLDGNSNSSNEEYETLFKLFANAFYKGASPKTLEDDWITLLNDSTNSIENNFFECDMTIYSDEIEMIVFEG